MSSRIHLRPWHKDVVVGILILLFILPLLAPLLRPTLPVTHDGHHHIFRLYALDGTLRGGAFWPRWLPQMAFGYGFPIFNFYAPLVYYIGEWFHVFGLGFLNTFRLLIALGFILPAWAFYAFGRTQFSRLGAFIGALVYTYATYHVGDGYVRAALPEHWAFLYPPLILLAMNQIGRRRSSLWPVAGGLLLAAFFLTHNLSVILFSPVFLVYAIGWLVAERRQHTSWKQSALIGYLLMAGLGVGLTAFFTLPGALEIKHIHASTVSAGMSDYLASLTSRLSAQMAFPWLDSSPAPYPNTLYQFLLAGAGLLGAVLAWRRMKTGQRWHLIFFLGVALFSIFLMLTASAPLVRLFPPLSYLQYAWRWNAPLVMALAWLAGGLSFFPMLASGVWQRRTSWGIAGLFVVILLALVLPASFPGSLDTIMTAPNQDRPLAGEDLRPGILEQYDYQTGLWLRNYGGPWLFEYLPVWAEDVRDSWFLPDDSPEQLPPTPGVPDIRIEKQAALEQILRISHDQPFTMRWHAFYFPGWETLVDGKPVATTPSTELGLVTADIPAGDHQVISRFGTTPVRQISGVISILTLLLLLGGLIWKRQWRMLAALAAVALIALLPLKWHQLSASAVYTPEQPQEDWTIFEDRAQLLGYHVSGEYRPGQILAVTLHWQALRNIAENDQVFIALVDANGRSWSQIDRQPGFNFTPTSRWQPGELMADTYLLELPPDLPPGVYQLRMGMHDSISGQRRSVHDGQGHTSDQIWLGDITIEP
jgi:hypothetical protein